MRESKCAKEGLATRKSMYERSDEPLWRMIVIYSALVCREALEMILSGTGKLFLMPSRFRRLANPTSSRSSQSTLRDYD